AVFKELNNLVRAAQTDLAEANAKERNLDALLTNAKVEAFEVNKKQIDFDRLKREADSNQRLYDIVLKSLKDIELSGLLRTSNVRVLDVARPDPVPVRPNVKLHLAVAAVVGLLAGLGLAFAAEYLDTTINDQAQLEEWLSVVALGIIPRVNGTSSERSVDL